MKKGWRVLWRIGKADLRFMWFALHHRDRPRWLLPIAIAIGVYAVAPFNIVIPVIGLLDDLILVPLALHFLIGLLPPHIRLDFNRLRNVTNDDRSKFPI